MWSCVCACNASELVLWLRFLGSKRSEYIVVWCVCVYAHNVCAHNAHELVPLSSSVLIIALSPFPAAKVDRQVMIIEDEIRDESGNFSP